VSSTSSVCVSISSLCGICWNGIAYVGSEDEEESGERRGEEDSMLYVRICACCFAYGMVLRICTLVSMRVCVRSNECAESSGQDERIRDRGIERRHDFLILLRRRKEQE